MSDPQPPTPNARPRQPHLFLLLALCAMGLLLYSQYRPGNTQGLTLPTAGTIELSSTPPQWSATESDSEPGAQMEGDSAASPDSDTVVAPNSDSQDDLESSENSDADSLEDEAESQGN